MERMKTKCRAEFLHDRKDRKDGKDRPKLRLGIHAF